MACKALISVKMQMRCHLFLFVDVNCQAPPVPCNGFNSGGIYFAVISAEATGTFNCVRWDYVLCVHTDHSFQLWLSQGSGCGNLGKNKPQTFPGTTTICSNTLNTNSFLVVGGTFGFCRHLLNQRTSQEV